MIGALRLRFGSVSAASDTPAGASDADLVAAARFDVRAFEGLYLRYADPVYRFCYRRLGDPQAAEDATAQVFVKAIAGLSGFRGGTFRAWLFAIAANAVADHYRQTIDCAPLAAAESVPNAEPTPEAWSLAAERRRAVRHALAHLPAGQRRIVELRLAGLSGPEIAEALGQSLAAVKCAQTRAYSRLRGLLADGREEGDDDR